MIDIVIRTRPHKDTRDWEELPAKRIRFFLSEEDNTPAGIRECIIRMCQLTPTNCQECRWNYAGSLQGHYFSPIKNPAGLTAGNK